jgi:hypothetical protein
VSLTLPRGHNPGNGEQRQPKVRGGGQGKGREGRAISAEPYSSHGEEHGRYQHIQVPQGLRGTMSSRGSVGIREVTHSKGWIQETNLSENDCNEKDD